MNDDWSLKGKEIYRMKIVDGEFKLLGKYYPDVYIKILREKLIEDTNNFQDMLLARLTSYLSFPLKGDKETMKTIEDISQIANELFRKYKNTINRRFGVEEENE